ncbi:MFS-type transporter pynF [Trichoderma asperellum]|uniref:MFS-type transporter pynF n=1 Tax=Trichoderma asperellum TaxID=101201 RepID=A0A6V8QLL6_TRIAP|nr:MFS-type transporter pynF [Trichoderma asperellum]
MEDAQFARDIASGVCIIDIPPAQATIPGGLESPATSFAASEETKVLEGPIVDAGDSSGSIPDGGLRAWLVVVGGFLDFAIAFGLVNSFGTFQARYETRWTWLSTSTITWIGSVQPGYILIRLLFPAKLFILFLGGAVVGPIYDKYGSRALMFSGTAVCLLSFICSSFATHYYQYLLSQGILLGIGNALLFYPATGAISEWFNHKRGLALGIALSGSSVGGIFWPLIINKLFTVLDASWVHRVIALISIPILLIACFLVKERNDTEACQIKSSERSIRGAVFEWRFFSLCLSLFFIYGGMLIPFYFIPLFAIQHGVGSTMANSLLAIGYAGSFVGRVGSGWIADRLGRFNVLFVMGVLTAAITFCWVAMTTLSSMIAFTLLFGLFSGGLIPLGSACVAQTTPDMGHIGLRIGFMMAFASFSALSGGPASGAIKDATTSWFSVQSFSAALTLLGAMMIFGLRLWLQPLRKGSVF